MATVKSLETMHAQFSEAFNAGDIGELMTLYEPVAGIEPEPGTLVEGTEAVRGVLEGFLAIDGDFTFATTKIVQCADLGLLHGHWTLDGTAPDGTAVSLSGNTSEVVRRQADGSWLYVIDLPDDV